MLSDSLQSFDNAFNDLKNSALDKYSKSWNEMSHMQGHIANNSNRFSLAKVPHFHDRILNPFAR